MSTGGMSGSSSEASSMMDALMGLTSVIGAARLPGEEAVTYSTDFMTLVSNVSRRSSQGPAWRALK
jgi:hypothetical protein